MKESSTSSMIYFYQFPIREPNIDSGAKFNSDTGINPLSRRLAKGGIKRVIINFPPSNAKQCPINYQLWISFECRDLLLFSQDDEYRACYSIK